LKARERGPLPITSPPGEGGDEPVVFSKTEYLRWVGAVVTIQ